MQHARINFKKNSRPVQLNVYTIRKRCTATIPPSDGRSVHRPYLIGKTPLFARYHINAPQWRHRRRSRKTIRDAMECKDSAEHPSCASQDWKKLQQIIASCRNFQMRTNGGKPVDDLPPYPYGIKTAFPISSVIDPRARSRIQYLLYDFPGDSESDRRFST